MSTNFERRLFMPAGPLGRTTALGPNEARIIRWYAKEWSAFVTEVEAYKLKVLEQYRTLQNRARDARSKCPHCRQTYARFQEVAAFAMRFGLPKYQRGSIQMAGFGNPVIQTDCTFTASTIPNITAFNIQPSDSWTHGRLFSDGDWYSNFGSNSSWGASEGTWQGSCAIADYDTRWNQTSGDTENSPNTVGVDGVYSAATISAAVGYRVTTVNLLSGVFSVQCRDGTSLTTLFTDAFNMSCEVETKN